MSVVEVSRHPSLYFSDGDIVLSAKIVPNDSSPTTENLQMFRVHSFLLKHHSPLFADMFSLPPPTTLLPSDAYDGVPLVTLYDSASDLASLLDVLYNPGYVCPECFGVAQLLTLINAFFMKCAFSQALILGYSLGHERHSPHRYQISDGFSAHRHSEPFYR